MSTLLRSQKPNTGGFSVPEVRKKSFKRSDFVSVKELGKGGFGTVSLCREKDNTIYVAMKQVSKKMLASGQALRQLQREIGLQHTLRHKNILMLFGYFDDRDHVYIMLEPCQLGSLYKVLRKNRVLSLHRACFVVDCLADALQYCHDRHIIHRDVKPENVLLTGPFVPKLADFGWAVRTETKNQQTLCGTPDYLSPEMLDFDNRSAHTFKIDNWSLGVLFFECLAGKAPFYDKDQTTTFENIKSAHITTATTPEEIPPEAMKVIKGLLTVDPKRRLKLKNVRKNEFIQAEAAKLASKKIFRRPTQ
uniref:Aurora kinase n=1 Tax=Panagrellus redivivus TaxID=6233 RepID=A0A7E4ZRS5_PANRE